MSQADPTVTSTPRLVSRSKAVRRLVLVLGDQLDANSAVWDGFDPSTDLVLMAEVAGESTVVWVSKVRIALFLAAMRQFRDRLEQMGRVVEYRRLTDPGAPASLDAAIEESVRRHRPAELWCVEPGEWRVRELVRQACGRSGVPLRLLEDRHFLCATGDFERHRKARKQLRMEYFYREMRSRTGILMGEDGPAGGSWNYDEENRSSFGAEGPPWVAQPIRFAPDATTREVIHCVEDRFKSHPGSTASFDWPVTAEAADRALDDFVANRLAHFGRWQDAMWTGEPLLFHSRLSAAMNLKLLDPRRVIRRVEQAWEEGAVPLAAAEGFIRQILGWREYVRGVYWSYMPDYLDRNALGAVLPLPGWYWTGETSMNCLRQALRQTLDHGYAHHIQRLMVTGLFALLLGVNPREVHAWYLAVYVDAVEWVELPNTLGMSQYADGGVMASKPYVASGKYIQRMSNYCKGCRYNPGEASGAAACPFTTLYWAFLDRHEPLLRSNPRMGMQLRNLSRLSATVRADIAREAEKMRLRFCASGN